MTAQELFQYLTDGAGLDEATTKVIMDQVAKNEKVSGRASGLKQASEYEALNTRAQALEKAAKDAAVYQDWYAKNYAGIEKLQKDTLRYQERYGSLDEPTEQPHVQTQQTKGLSPEEVQRIIDERVGNVYGNQWSNLITGAGTILEKHLRSKRDKEIDWKALGDIAAKKGGDLTLAYEEWDAPERHKSQQAAQDAEVQRRVKEELAKQQTTNYFPASSDSAPSTAGITRSSADKKYDRNAVIQAAVTGQYEPATR